MQTGKYSKPCGNEPQLGATTRLTSRVMGRASHISAGLLAFRRKSGLEVLLAHPGGPFWANKDNAAWTIPKGLAEGGADLLATAKREFAEETGFSADGAFIALSPVKQNSGKVVHAWAIQAEFDLTKFKSNTFELEWPPRSGRRKSFPEIERIAWFTLPQAETKIHIYQRPFLLEMRQRFGS
jgi:predicted NUDIX family NTP pyrophosphohydrolase